MQSAVSSPASHIPSGTVTGGAPSAEAGAERGGVAEWHLPNRSRESRDIWRLAAFIQKNKHLTSRAALWRLRFHSKTGDRRTFADEAGPRLGLGWPCASLTGVM